MGSATGRFWSKVDIRTPEECWDWKAYIHPNGYGTFSLAGYTERAHRVAYWLTYGPIPDGSHVLHTCDNKPCCNPSHLYLGSNQDNIDDKVAKGRQAKGEAHGKAKLTEEQVLLIRDDSRSLRSIAKEYGVGHQLVGRIKRGERWTHV